MQVLKWIAIGIACVGALVLVGCVGTFGWLMSAETITITEADLEKGGEFPEAERAAMISACSKQAGGVEQSEKLCSCVADVASTEMSRFERLTVTAVFEGSPGKIVGLIKGAASSGVDPERLQLAQTESEGKQEEMQAAMTRCAVDTVADTGETSEDVASGEEAESNEETVSSEEKTAGEEDSVETNSEESSGDERPAEESNEEDTSSDEESEGSNDDERSKD